MTPGFAFASATSSFRDFAGSGRMNYDRVRRTSELRHGREITHEVVGQLLVQADASRLGNVDLEECVAVR